MLLGDYSSTWEWQYSNRDFDPPRQIGNVKRVTIMIQLVVRKGFHWLVENNILQHDNPTVYDLVKLVRIHICKMSHLILRIMSLMDSLQSAWEMNLSIPPFPASIGTHMNQCEEYISTVHIMAGKLNDLMSSFSPLKEAIKFEVPSPQMQTGETTFIQRCQELQLYYESNRDENLIQCSHLWHYFTAVYEIDLEKDFALFIREALRALCDEV